MTAHTPYIGRFAPTPSGPLHLGSLVTAVASWLDARSHNGQWLLRIDDIDPPREQAGAADLIQQQLEAFALTWDGHTLFQSQRTAVYNSAIFNLLERGLAFHCNLSRSRLAQLGGTHPGPRFGPEFSAEAGPDTAIRIQVPNETLHFVDAIAGEQQLNLNQEEGAFVIRRRDGLFAYQLACAIDDAQMNITHVLRGDDLLSSTFRQQYVMTCLGHEPPQYAHLPVIRDEHGEKLAKSIQSAALTLDNIHGQMAKAMDLLGLKTDAEASAKEQLQQALAQWQSPFNSGFANCPQST